MKKALSIILFCVFSLVSQAQLNIVKLNTTSTILWRLPEVQYERVINDQISLQLGFGVWYPSTTGIFQRSFRDAFDGALTDSLNDFSSDFDFSPMNGIRITPEVRIFLASEPEAPKGFYFNPYLRYINYGNSVSYNYLSENGNVERAKFRLQYYNTSLGIGAGYQWITPNERVALDFNFAGIGYGKSKFKISISSTETGIDWGTLENDFNSNDSSDDPYESSLETKQNKDGLEIKIRTPLNLSWRTSFSIGYRF